MQWSESMNMCMNVYVFQVCRLSIGSRFNAAVHFYSNSNSGARCAVVGLVLHTTRCWWWFCLSELVLAALPIVFIETFPLAFLYCDLNKIYLNILEQIEYAMKVKKVCFKTAQGEVERDNKKYAVLYSMETTASCNLCCKWDAEVTYRVGIKERNKAFVKEDVWHFFCLERMHRLRTN